MKIENLPGCIRIQSGRFKTCLNSVIERTKINWELPLFTHYTRHGTDHSERITDAIGKLLEEYPDLLNENERFILLSAVYLHDIGMQSPVYAGLQNKTEYNLEELEKIRENHHEASAKMILESISSKSKLLLGLELCKDYADFIATVSKYHRKLDIKEIKDKNFSGEKIRLKLLSSILRLGDALDADHRRVNMEILNLREIPVESKFHWWFHHYVQSVAIEKGKITLYYRFPAIYKNNSLVIFFKDQIYETISRQFIEVYDILDSYGIRLYRQVVSGDLNYVTEGVLELVPKELSDYIEKEKYKRDERAEKLSKTTGVTWYLDGIAFSDDKTVKNKIDKIIELMEKGRNKEAAEVIVSCSTLVMSPKDRLTFCLNAGNCLYILGNFNEANKYFKDVLELSQRKDLQEMFRIEMLFFQGAAFGNIGLIYSDKGELDVALKYHKEALKVHREIGYRQGEADQFGNIGLIYHYKGDLDEALKYHKEALTIDREIGYRQGEASDLGNIGLMYSDKGDLDEALKYHKEALKIHREIGYRQGEANALGSIGLIYRAKGELDEALKYINEALTIDLEIIYRKGEAIQLGNIGIIYSAKGELDEALKYHNEALKIHREIGYRQGEAIQLGNIGIIYSAKGEHDKALKYLNDALEICKIAAPGLVVQMLNNIANIYFEKQDFEKGFEYKALAILKASVEQIKIVLSSLERIIREMIKNSKWEDLEKIHSTYNSGIITDNNWINFFTVVHDYAVYKKTKSESDKKKYSSSRKKLKPELKKFLDEIFKVKKR